MKNNFAKYLTRFFTDYLSQERGASHNTLRSYGNAFTSFLDFMSEVKCVPAERLSCEHLTRENVLSFLQWIQDRRKCSIATRNQRLAAIHSFCKYLQYEDVTLLEQWQSVLSIKFKKHASGPMNYLSVDGVRLLLSQILTTSREGSRDLAMIALLYDSGTRVQELIDLTPLSLHLVQPYYVTLFGKGRKKRLVPLLESQVVLLKNYMDENHLFEHSYNQRPLFTNNRGGRLTNAGIAYILKRHVKNAHIVNPELIPEKITPHCLRHSKAMHLLQAGVNLVYIRDILGHVSIQTTEVYARADSKQKREALESAYIDVIPQGEKITRSWEKDAGLKSWLKNLGK